MRLILQSDNFTPEMILVNQEFYKVVKITEILATGANYTLKQALTLANITESQFEGLQPYFDIENGYLKSNLFNYFKNNKENVQKFRNKNKVIAKPVEKPVEVVEVIQEPVIKKAPKKSKASVIESKINFKLLFEMYYHYFEDSMMQMPLEIDDDRKKILIKLYDKKHKPEDEENPLTFFRRYYEILLEKKTHKGWYNKEKGEQVRPHYDYIHKPETYSRLAT